MPGLEEIIQALKDAHERRFWGMLQVDFQRGVPTLLRISETKKLESTAKEKYQNGNRY